MSPDPTDVGWILDSHVESLGSLAAILCSCQDAISETDGAMKLGSVPESQWAELPVLRSGQAYVLLRPFWRRSAHVVPLSEELAKSLEKSKEGDVFRSLRVNGATYSALLNHT